MIKLHCVLFAVQVQVHKIRKIEKKTPDEDILSVFQEKKKSNNVIHKNSPISVCIYVLSQ